ncbi:TRAP transporter substrate-binding protein [Maribellus maritimus]|uniref:TRAP transporter substrate-binding protein n=1 Tax=Maribellus maritimus TaxID=2870838 RepID=UPI001EE9DBFA|nr:TRAP transporter substrate-binding protein [Maribellus maritimus]MCG6190779.1 TRAP transporter substrate-binding protein [Maribellus maritimus]
MNFYNKIIILLLVTFIVSSCSTKKDYKEFRLAYVMAPGGTSHAAAEKFGELVSQKSEGKIKVKLYPNGILGNDRILVEGLSLRSVDMIIAGPSIIGWNAPKYGVIEAPFVFNSYTHMEKVMYGEIGKEIETAIYKNRKIHFLAFLHRGPRYLTTTNKIIKTPDDLNGLKLRVPELPIYIKSWKTFGANPTPLAYSDMFMALKQGVVEGQENPLEVIYTSHLYETQKYIMKTEHLISFYTACIGDYFLKKFDKNEQKIIIESIKEAAKYQNDMVKKYEEKFTDELKAAGVDFIDVDRNAFEKLAVQKLPELFKDTWAPNIYQRIRDVK